MTFPATPAPFVVEIAPGADLTNRGVWVWQDITPDVRLAEGIRIEGGRRDEGNQADTTICHLILNNRNGNYSPRNAEGTWYGDLARNTPIRVRWTVDEDPFTTPVAGGWGTSPGGHTWTTFGSGGTVDASDFEVVGGEGAHYVEAADAYRGTYLSSLDLLDLEIVVTTRTNLVAAPTGAEITHGGVMFRVQDDQNYYLAGYAALTSGDQSLRLWKVVAGVRTQLVGTGVVEDFPVDTPGKIKVQVVGAEINVKSWEASGDEPVDWDITWVDYEFGTAGGVGIRSGVAVGNTDTKPIRFYYDDFTVFSDRFVGYVTEWPTRWDITGRDSWVPIEACGVLRRLEQGTAPLLSSLRRRILRLFPLAYWPLEDGEGSTSAGSAISGVDPMEVTGFTFGADTENVGSAPLPTMTVGSSYSADVPIGGNNQWCVSFAYNSVVTTTNTIIQVRTTGTIRRWQIRLRTTDVNVRGYDQDDTLQIDATGALVVGFSGEWNSLHLSVFSSGANIGYQLRWTRGDGSSETYNPINTTYATATPGEVTRVYLESRGAGADELSIGHISVWATALQGGTAYSSSAMAGHPDEWVTTRLSRLCSENQIPFVTQFVSASPDPADMGPQPITDLVDALRECEAADGGLLYEVDGGLSYIDRAARYNPPVWMAIDADNGELVLPEPSDDDLQLTNDVTVSRVGGSSARAVNQDSIDTQGSYETQVELNVYQDSQLAPMAAWLVHLGSVDELRWPRIQVNLARNPSLIPAWMSYRPGSRLTVAHTITQLPGVDIDVLAEGWTEVIEPYNYRVELNCVPASPWILGELDDDGRLDTAGSNLAVDVASPTVLNSNPYFETDTSGWFGSGGTFARSTVQAHTGVASGLLTPDGVVGTAEAGITTAASPAVTPAETYQWSVWVYSPVGDSVILAVRWRDAADATISTVSSSATAVAAGVWTRLTAAFTAPALSAKASGRVWLTGTPAVTDLLYIDDAELTPGASLSVSTSTGPVWTTDAAEFPFDIKVGGERMTVTAITGASSPQTFTVIRAVNGVVKSHVAGWQVKLFRPIILAL